MTLRQHKVARLIQKELADIFQKETKKTTVALPPGIITVTHVLMSKDLSLAKIYLSIYSTKDKMQLLRQINAHKKEIRKWLGDRIGKQLRTVPELAFFSDDSAEFAERIDAILNQIRNS